MNKWMLLLAVLWCLPAQATTIKRGPGGSGTSAFQNATDCALVLTAPTGSFCQDLDSNALYVCEVGPCSGTNAWTAYVSAGGLASTDIDTSLEIKTIVTDETGSGALVFANTPTLVTPILGTPTSGVMTNMTGLVSAGIVDDTITAADLNATLTFADADLISMASVSVSSATEGILLPQHATTCAAATAEGQVCWEADANHLWVGDGAAAVDIGPGAGGGAPTTATYLTSTADATLSNEIAVGTFADDQLIVGSGAGTASLKTLADCDDTGGNHVNYDTTTNAFTCGTSGGAGGGITGITGDSGTATDATSVTVVGASTDRGGIVTASSATTDAVNVELKYSGIPASNLVMNAKECVFTTSGTSGGGFLCEGSTGSNANEPLFLFPAIDTETTNVIVTGSGTTAVPTGFQITGTPDGTKFLRDDGVWTAGAGGSSAFSAITGSTNTTAAMVIGSGATMTANGGYFATGAAPANTSGAVRLSNADFMCWEASPAGTDVCMNVDSSEQFVFGATTNITGNLVVTGPFAQVSDTSPSYFLTDTSDSAGFVADTASDNNVSWGISNVSGTDGARVHMLSANTTGGATTLYLGGAAAERTYTTANGVSVTEAGDMVSLGTGSINGTGWDGTYLFIDADNDNTYDAGEKILNLNNATNTSGDGSWSGNLTVVGSTILAGPPSVAGDTIASGELLVGTGAGTAGYTSNVAIAGTFSATSLTASPSATPTVALRDSDNTDSEDNVRLTGNCVVTSTGAEDCTATIDQYVDGAVKNTISSIGDGAGTIGSDQNTSWTIVTDGTGTAELVVPDGSISGVEIGTEVRSMWFGASGASVDGTQCATPAEVTINSGPKQYTVICTDNDSSTIYGSVKMPDSWDGGTVTFEQVYIQTAADTSALNGDIAAQCHGNGETVDSTYGTEIAIDDAAVTGSNKNDFTTSAAVTPAGTCAAGDMLYWRWQLDATGTTTAVATLHTLGFKMEYTSNVGD